MVRNGVQASDVGGNEAEEMGSGGVQPVELRVDSLLGERLFCRHRCGLIGSLAEVRRPRERSRVVRATRQGILG